MLRGRGAIRRLSGMWGGAAVIALPLAASLFAVAPSLGWAAHLVLLALLLASLGTGRLVCLALGVSGTPFLALVTGFAIIVHALLLADLLVPGAHPAVAAAFVLPAIAGFLLPPCHDPMRPMAGLGLAVMVGLFVLAWCADVAPRLAHFRATGELDFWIDLLTHAGNLAQFSQPSAIGRGMMWMADWPRPLYHFGSLMPVAMLPQLAGTTPLDAVALAWIPLGMVVMAAGVVALGVALGGAWLGAFVLLALAILPAPEQWSLGNGFLGFAWLLETAPGTPYSLGVACASFAALAYAARERKVGALVLAALLTASCLLIRANTFIWLAPTVVLGAVAVWHWPAPRWRIAVIGLGFVGLLGLFGWLSWSALTTDAPRFLFGYISEVHTHHSPTRVDGLFALSTAWVGPVGTALFFLGLTLFGTLGPWLPGFLLLGSLSWRRGLLTRVDALPMLLLSVATLAMMLAPLARNGDMGEYRHRAGPLLVAILAVWTVHFARLLVAPRLGRIPAAARRAALLGGTLLALVTLTGTIGSAKRPTMGWARDTYGTQVPPELMAMVPLLAQAEVDRPRFALANQPTTSRFIDDAARITGLTGIPAFISCPAFLLATGGAIGEEATRRMGVIAKLTEASNLEELRAIMRAQGITHWVVTSPTDAPFDAERRDASWSLGNYAVYPGTR